MKRLIFIASLAHSGSTLLDLILGGHSRFVGLGEIAKVLRPDPMGSERTREVLCSCGSRIDECVFWGKVASKLQAAENLSIRGKYEILLDTFENVFGQDCIPVDSSKYVKPLQLLCNNPKVDIRVLFLIRDVRSFTISHMDIAKRKKLNYIRRIPAYHFWQWYRGNRKIQQFLRKENIQSFQIGYEELCLYPNLIIQKICDFLGEKPEPSMLSLKDSGSHVIRGNRMRYQLNKRQGILYDNRWFYRNEWILPAAFFANIMVYNTREVYSNETEPIWSQ